MKLNHKTPLQLDEFVEELMRESREDYVGPWEIAWILERVHPRQRSPSH